jgi:ubiquinone biosynthesis protein UbiJ
MPATAAWLASVEALLNRRIADVARAQNAVRRLEGTALRLEVEGVKSVRMSVRGGRLLLAAADEAPVDVLIRGTPGALLELALRQQGVIAAAPAEGAGGVHIEGDAEVAARYRELLSGARPELEEELARYLGDLPARGIARALHAAAGFARRARRAAGTDLAEYLTEESRTLLGRAELEEFFLEVDRLRETADRVAARLARLELASKGGAR